MAVSADGDVWIFGYGSLIFRPDFPFVERREGFIRGWARRFWQASPDHRGTPEAPGRVVTLVACADAHCWGVAYRVSAAERGQVLERLDYRERNGYQRQVLSFFSHAGPLTDVIVYVADPQNPSYVGPEDERQTAAIVRGAHGPSGSNRDYVLRLAAELARLGVEDAHVSSIARAVAASPGDSADVSNACLSPD
jgi:cation transport regulator ChaC